MKLILIMVVLATALSTSGCASRRNAAAKALKAEQTAQARQAAQAKTAPTPAVTAAPAPAKAETVTYAVSSAPGTAPVATKAVPAVKTVADTNTSAAPATKTAAVIATPVALVPAPAATKAEAGVLDNIDQVPFRISTSSVSVERLAKAQGCVGGKGASLVTEKGPVEVYRMQCENGKVFLAKCELRQCSPLRW